YISIAIFISLLVGYFFIPGMGEWLDQAWSVLTSGDEQKVSEWVDGFGYFGPILIILVMTVQMFLIVIPSWLLMLVAIIAYGPVWGSAIVFVAIFSASSVGYLIGRYFGPEVVARIIGPSSEKKVADFLDRYGVWAIIVTRINPLLSNDAISFIAGVVNMSYRKFILSTLVGIAPLVILIAILRQMDDGLKSGLIWVSAGSLLLFIGFVWFDKRQRKRTP